MKVTLFFLVISSVVFSQIIIDQNSEQGKKLIAQMMTAVNAHEELKHEMLEFVDIVSILGQNGHYTVYLSLKNHEGVSYHIITTVNL